MVSKMNTKHKMMDGTQHEMSIAKRLAYDTLHYNQRLRLTTIQHHDNGQSMQLEFQNDQ